MFDCIGRQKEQDAQVLWPDGGCGRSSEAMRGRRSSEKANRGLSFERWLVCPAGMGAYFCFSLAACAARRMTRCASGSFKRVKLGLSFERRLLRPAGTGAFLFMLFGPPARRAADGGLLGAAAPPRPPLHSPRTTPLGLSYIPTPTEWPLRAFQIPPFREGCAASASGASSLRSVISLRAAQCQRAPSR